MDTYRQRNTRSFRSRDSLERRVDKLIQTGKQVVDGVAGNRPGMRKDNNGRFNRSGIDNVSRWVEEKIDWFLEDEDDWIEPIESRSQQSINTLEKRPLTAISLRGPKLLKGRINNDIDISEEAWPNDSSFKINKWKREEKSEGHVDQKKSSDPINLQKRPLPRSNRRRY